MKKALIVALIISMIANGVMYVNRMDIKEVLQQTNVELDRVYDDYAQSKDTVQDLTKMYEDLNLDYETLKTNYNSLSNQHEELTKKHEQLSRGGNTVQYKEFEATAYTHTGYATKTGVMPKVGRTIAVDPRVIPLGSKVYIEGLGWRIAEDTGRLIKGQIIDVFLNTESECEKFGRKKVKIYLQK